jgi:hypothetical protein
LVIGLGAEPAIGDQHLMRMHAATFGKIESAGERRAIDQPLQQELITGWSQRVRP